MDRAQAARASCAGAAAASHVPATCLEAARAGCRTIRQLAVDAVDVDPSLDPPELRASLVTSRPNLSPLWPLDFVRCPNRADHNRLLLGRKPPISKACQRGLNEPGLKRHPGALPI